MIFDCNVNVRFQNVLTYEDASVHIKLEPRSNDSPTPSLSSFAPMDAATAPQQTSSRPSTKLSISSTYSNWTMRSESDEFMSNIAKKLERIPQGKLRRQLEIKIEQEILCAENLAIDEGLICVVEHAN